MDPYTVATVVFTPINVALIVSGRKYIREARAIIAQAAASNVTTQGFVSAIEDIEAMDSYDARIFCGSEKWVRIRNDCTGSPSCAVELQFGSGKLLGWDYDVHLSRGQVADLQIMLAAALERSTAR